MSKSLVRAFALLLFAAAASLHAQVQPLINYQGRVTVGTTNFNGSGAFKFALVNTAGTTTYWSNDGTSVAGSQPAAAVTLTVTKGLYSVLLGDTALANMTAIPNSVFANADVRLRVWFNDGTNGSQLLTPDQRLAPNGYLPDGAVGATAIASGAITSAKLAAGAVGPTQLADDAVTSAKIAAAAVTANEIAGGAVGASQLAAGAVGSAQLADSVAFGDASSLGQLDVFCTSANTPSISLFGSGSRISTYGSDGLEQTRLWGDTWGELLLRDSSVTNNIAVVLSANGISGGFLSLRDGSNVERANLRAISTGGKLTLIDDAGVPSLLLDSGASRQLEIVDAQAIARMTTTGNVSGSVLELRNNTASPTNLGAFNFLDLNGAVAGQIRYTGANEIVFANNTNGRAMTIDANRNVAISNALTSASHKLDVDGSVRIRSNANQNNLLFNNDFDDINLDLIKDSATAATATPSARIKFDGFTDQATHRGSLLFFTRTTGDADVVERMRIEEAGGLSVLGTATFASPVNLSNTLAVAQNAVFNANVGIGDPTPDAKLDVQQSGNTVAIFDRTTNDGTVISIQRDSAQQGTITVTGATVSYNAFTGSHYALTDEPLEFAQLVSMTGKTHRRHDDANSEPIYGITLATVPNDPKCLGSFLGRQDSARPVGLENPLLVMAVGNGDMWVTDTGGDIQPGDFLISSGVGGCAMKDDPARFAVGNIIARAAEVVDWSKVAARDGVKRAKISVLFGNFVRQAASRFSEVTEKQARSIHVLKLENARLRIEQAAIRAQLETILGEVRELRKESPALVTGPLEALVLSARHSGSSK